MHKAYITEIQHFCVHDGPGIRTTVFFQGCPMRCRWCQNPETLYTVPVFMYNAQLCTGCMACLNACPKNAIFMEQSGNIKHNPERCELCGHCVEECYFMASTFSSKRMSAKEIWEDVIKDEVVYKKSGGGITL